MGWRPADFWAATSHEFCAAIDEHNRANDPGQAEAEEIGRKTRALYERLKNGG